MPSDFVSSERTELPKTLKGLSRSSRLCYARSAAFGSYFASDSQLIADIIAQIVVAPEVLCILLQSTAFNSLAQIMGRSTALTLEGVADKLAKGVVPKRISMAQCKNSCDSDKHRTYRYDRLTRKQGQR